MNFQIASLDLVIMEDISEKLHPKPIPLTTEVLEKCGIWNFKTEKSIDGIYFLFAFSDGLDGSSKISSVSVIQDDDIITLRHIEHLHQLQNLIFALTGEELIYKP